jgi:3-oxoacyl-[acyl-carrier-protein] synthase III
VNRIAGTGMCVPDVVVGSHEVEGRLGLGAGTIAQFLGVRERRIAPRELAVSDLAVAAGRDALRNARLDAADIGLAILATSTPDHPVPATAPQVAHRLAVTGPAFDLMNTCSGWIYALATADAHLKAGTAEHALVIGANVLSRRLDAADWSTSGLFGDGAGAVVLSAGAGRGRLMSTALDADGANWHRIQVPAGGSRIPITPEAVEARQHLLRIAKEPGMLQESVRLQSRVARKALAAAGIAAQDVEWYLPHQSNARLILEGARDLGIPADRVLGNLDRYGNTSAASIPMLLHENAARLREGDRLLMAVVAGGMSAGAAVVAW